MSSDDVSDFDPDRYRAHLAELTLTEEQETELLRILFSIMRTFVEIGFAVEDCGQLLEAFEEAVGVEGDGLSLAGAINSERITHREEPL